MNGSWQRDCLPSHGECIRLSWNRRQPDACTTVMARSSCLTMIFSEPKVRDRGLGNQHARLKAAVDLDVEQKRHAGLRVQQALFLIFTRPGGGDRQPVGI